MDGIPILPHECIICLRRSIEKEGNPQTMTPGSDVSEGPGLENPNSSIFKLLNLNLEYSEDDYGNLFCDTCEVRNGNIFELFSKITCLQNELKVLRTIIEVDFRSSWETLKGRDENGNPAPDVLTATKQQICHEIAKRNPENFCLHYEPEQSVYGDSGWSDPSEFLECEAEFSENDHEEFDFSALKQIHRIKEVSVVIQKFPEHLLRDGRINVHRIPREYRLGDTRKLTGRQAAVLGQFGLLLPCAFADCPWKLSFVSKFQRDIHMKEFHGIEIPVTSKSSRLEKAVKSCMDGKDITGHSSSSINVCSPLNLPKRKIERNDHIKAPHEVSVKPSTSGLKCIFADCISGVTFSNSTELDEHVRLEHSVDVKVALKKKRGRPSTAAKTKPNNRMLVRRHSNQSKIVSLYADNSEVSNDNQDDTFEPDHTTSSEVKSNLDGKLLKCLFADCTSRIFFRTKEERDEHVSREHQKEQNESTASSNNYTEREAIEESNDAPQKFKCVFADCQDFDTLKARDEHVKTEHQSFKAIKTKKSVTKPSRLKKLDSANPKANLFCVVEGCLRKKIFPSEADLKMHMKQFHEGLTHPYKCTACDRYFARKGQRAEHYRVKHLKLKPFMCHYCGAAFSASPNLKRHLTRHTNEKNFTCSVCQKAFKTPDGCRIHMRYAHTGERPYSCDRCGKGFVTNGHLVKHMKCVHNPTDRPHVCHICGKSFPIHGYLYMHIRNSHEGVKRKRSAKPKGSTSSGNVQTDSSGPAAPIPEPENADSTSHSSPNPDQYVPSGNPPTEFNFQQQPGNLDNRAAPGTHVDYHAPRGNSMDLPHFPNPACLINQSDVSHSVFSQAVGLLNPDLTHLSVPADFKNLLHPFYPGQNHFTGDSSLGSNRRF